MAVNNGPAEGNGVLTFNTNAPGLETSLPNGTPSLSPAYAPYQTDPQSPYTGTVVNKVVAGIQVSIPA